MAPWAVGGGEGGACPREADVEPWEGLVKTLKAYCCPQDPEK